MAGELILIIEDNDKNRKLARDVLQVKGYKTIESETAEEGLELARNQSPALILMDIQLPGMDGLQLTRHLRRDASLNGVPIVAFTASAIKGDEDIALASGCDGYVTKPIDTRTLGNQVREFLNHARPARTHAS